MPVLFILELYRSIYMCVSTYNCVCVEVRMNMQSGRIRSYSSVASAMRYDTYVSITISCSHISAVVKVINPVGIK